MPVAVDISVIGAVINLGKVDGTNWDGFGEPTAEDLQAVTLALTALTPLGQFSGVVTALGNAVMGATSKPDPFGTLELAWQGPFDPSLNQPLPLDGTSIQDSFTPDWPGLPKPGWINVPFSEGLQVRISLVDADLSNDDAIGTVVVNAADVRDAYFANQVWPVRVDDQSSNQLLFITISVTASAPPPICGGECANLTYGACSCSSVDPCGWQADGVCDSFCQTNFPGDFFDDSADCP